MGTLYSSQPQWILLDITRSGLFQTHLDVISLTNVYSFLLAGSLLSAVPACLLLLLLLSSPLPMASAQVRPPNYSPDAIPETSFTCENKITGGYYADAEAECQLFHVCVQVSEYEVGHSSSRML